MRNLTERRWRDLLLQTLLVSGAIALYFGVRGLTEGKQATADANALRLLRFEDRLWLDIEQTSQEWLLGHESLVTFVNWIYIWGHWPVIAVTLVWLFLRHPGDYVVLRNAMFFSGAVGLIIFASYPVAPPRFLPEFTDTVTERSNAYRVLQPPGFINKNAALPSLHFGWNLLIGIAIYRVARSRLAVAYAIIGPILMGLAVVLTANHYVVDALAGGFVALLGLLVADRSQRRLSNLAEKLGI